MSLVISLNSAKVAVTQSDGRATGHGLKIISDDVQKIFPLKNRPIAIAHVGKNVFKEGSVGEVLRRLPFTANHPKGIMEELAAGVQEIVSTSWCSCPGCANRALDVIFLVHGYDTWGEFHRLELKWQYKDQAPTSNRRDDGWGWAFGSGHSSVNWRRVQKPPAIAEKMVACVDDVFADAMKNAPRDCGGAVQTLLIRTRQWSWLKPPPQEPITMG